MTSIVAIFGLLPASLATGLGSDVQRPLATVIVWGLFSSTTLTLFVVPVFYRMLAPALPRTQAEPEASEAEARALVEPLPNVNTAEVIRLIEHLYARGGQQDVFHICDETNRPFASIIAVVKAAEMLDLIETPGHMVVLTPKGKEFAEAGLERRRAIWREQLLALQLFRTVYDVVLRSPEKPSTAISSWRRSSPGCLTRTTNRFSTRSSAGRASGRLFHYDETVQRITLG